MNEIEVVRVMRWWIAKSPKRRRMAMEVGGFDEVVQEAYLGMLRGAKPKRKYMMTTIATNQVNWAIGKLWMKKNRDIIEEPSGLFLPVPAADNVVGECIVNERREEIWKVARQIMIAHFDANDRKSAASRSYDMLLRRMKGETLEEVGKAHSVSKERVRQIVSRAIRVLQIPSHECRFAGFQ